ncbi:hypothetical protein EP7_005394 [Isosphaeraceae bacterium EP7]
MLGRHSALIVLAGLIAIGPGPHAPASAGPPMRAPQDPAHDTIRLTVEVDWNLPAAVAAESPGPPVVELSEGTILGAVACGPAELPGQAPAPWSGGGWTLGPIGSGRARVRLETILGASLAVRVGPRVVRFPVRDLLDGPRRTAPPVPFDLGIERLAWDALEIDLPGEGIAAPSESVPVKVGLNLLTAEPGEMAVKLTAEIRPARGGEPTWTVDRHEIVVANAQGRPTLELAVPAPAAEGTYLLTLRASWEPLSGGDAPRRARWLRRRRDQASAVNATRTVSLAVVAREATVRPQASARGLSEEVDSLDLNRSRSYRPLAAGRSPVAGPGRSDWPLPEGALVEATRRDRLRGWLARGPEIAELPPESTDGLAWSALGLKVRRPGRPHRLTLSIIEGDPADLGVALVASNSAGGDRHRLLLDTRASGLPIAAPTPPASTSWLVWPDVAEPVLVLVNRGASRPIHLGSVSLTELAEPFNSDMAGAPKAGPARTLGLSISDRRQLDAFGGREGREPDFVAQSRNLGDYLAACGATSVALPSDLPDRNARRRLDGQAAEDCTGADRLTLLSRILARQGVGLWLEVGFDGTLPGLPAPDSSDAVARGLVRVSVTGQPDGSAYHPLHPEVRDAMKRRLAEQLEHPPGGDRFAGVLVRLGPGPTLLGGPSTGLDDASYGQFVAQTFEGETARKVPGMGADAGRFAARARFVEGPGHQPWLKWRARELGRLYAELADQVRGVSPAARLALVTPVLADGPAGDEARKADLAGLPAGVAWRAVGLDLEAWPDGPDAPVILRGASSDPAGLARDLATNPDLDAPVAARLGRGLFLGHDPASSGTTLAHSARPTAAGADADEPLGHALAAIDPRWAWVELASASGREGRLNRFGRVFNALPASASEAADRTEGRPPVAARTIAAGRSSYLILANDTPLPILWDGEILQASSTASAPGPPTVFDLGRGLALAPQAIDKGCRLALQLEPFGVAAVRIPATGVTLGRVVPHPAPAALAGLKVSYDDLSTRLARLDRQLDLHPPGPPNPGFELDGGATPAQGEPEAARLAAEPAGWHAVGSKVAVGLDPLGPRSGRTSLRLVSTETEGAVLSDAFATPAGPGMTVRAWLRADRAGARARLSLEGTAGGHPLVRLAEANIGPQWSEVTLRAADLPADGLSSARLRLELAGPGRLWVDDLALQEATLTEPERLNARRTLSAALQAYRERRFADFSRLAGSHWARQAAAADPLARTGTASALPTDRALR